MEKQRENLNIMANLLQLYNTFLLLSDAKNNDIMQALNEQNQRYFEQILQNQSLMIDLLQKILTNFQSDVKK